MCSVVCRCCTASKTSPIARKCVTEKLKNNYWVYWAIYTPLSLKQSHLISTIFKIESRENKMAWVFANSHFRPTFWYTTSLNKSLIYLFCFPQPRRKRRLFFEECFFLASPNESPVVFPDNHSWSSRKSIKWVEANSTQQITHFIPKHLPCGAISNWYELCSYQPKEIHWDLLPGLWAQTFSTLQWQVTDFPNFN